MTKRNRVTKKQYFSFEKARQLIRNNPNITSSGTYTKWHRRYKPTKFPATPISVYIEWKGWADFVGVINEFGVKICDKIRPFWEAVRFSQKLCHDHNITSGAQWFCFYEHNEKLIPYDIPKYPLQYYDQCWKGWPLWLGKTANARLVSQRQQLHVVAICTQSWTVSNIIRIVVEPDGLSKLFDIIQDDELTPLFVYKYDPNKRQEMMNILNKFGNVQFDGTFLISNINDIVFEFDNMFERVRSVDLQKETATGAV